jgi:TIR domain
VRGHRSAAAAADCPACSSCYGGYGGYRSYSSPSYSPSPSYSSSPSYSLSGSSGGGTRSSTRPRWSPIGSSVAYTPTEVSALTPIRNSVEILAKVPELRDVFLCHAWDDRQGPAKELHDLLEARGVRVWFSEKDVGLGVPLMRAIDIGWPGCQKGVGQTTTKPLRSNGKGPHSFLVEAF